MKCSAVMLLCAKGKFKYGERAGAVGLKLLVAGRRLTAGRAHLHDRGPDVPKGTLVYDYRFAPPKVEVIGDPDAFPKRREPSARRATPGPVSPAR